MNVAIVGGRDFDDYELFKTHVNGEKIKFKSIVSGGARGVDTLAERYAKELRVPVNIYLPDWTKHGKAAGPIRNKQIIENADCVIAFWDEKSSGTRSSIKIAEDLGKPLTIFVYREAIKSATR
jgi:predicted Rossmann fold nucleotide-binding protein DprA/Smf involved in DNA uptake